MHAHLKRVQEPVALQHGHFGGPACGHHVCIPSGCVVQICQYRQCICAPLCILQAAVKQGQRQRMPTIQALDTA